MLWDKSRRSFVLAVRSLWLHKLRSALSVLGIVIGTGAVITLMAFGEGSMQDALEDIKRQGATNIIVQSVKPPDDASSQRRTMTLAYGLTHADYAKFKQLDTIVGSVPMRIFKQELRELHRMHNGRVVGTTSGYRNVNKIELVNGRFLNDSDDDDIKNVVVIGADVAEALFPFQSASGKTIQLNGHDFIIIGVLKERTPLSNAGGISEDYNSDVYVPINTCRARWGAAVYLRSSGSRSGEQVELHQITLTISDIDKVRDAGAVIKDNLERDHGYKKDWLVVIPLDRIEEAKRAKDRYMMLLIVIAAISLLVGGIGIMNIMLATVTERTREIGIRRALGAKRADITLQFLIEATVQTTVGGVIGALIGIGLVFIAPIGSELIFHKNLPAQLNAQPVIMAMSFAVIVGVTFGLYPAYRASRLDPIEALRHD
ncbi:MAG: ABC transporter permease [Gemmataceae bacterium]|nr:ABC transporter permease [Gemmataceae bacterium]